VFFRLLFLLAALALSACGPKPSDARQAAADFFAQCASGHAGEAYASTASLFQLTRTREYFETRLRELALDQAAVEWGEPEVVAGTARLRGVFSRPQRQPQPLIAVLIQEGGRWKMLEVREETREGKRSSADIFEVGFRSYDLGQEKSRTYTEPVALPIPTESQLQRLADTAITEFNTALQKNDFTDFLKTTAERWRNRGKTEETLNYRGSDPRKQAEADPENREGRLTADSIRNEFHQFVEQKIDFSPVLGKTIVFEKAPELSSEGVLSLKGHYADYFFRTIQVGGVPEPYVLSFRIEFFYENAVWKLFGFYPAVYSAKLGQAPGATNP